MRAIKAKQLRKNALNICVAGDIDLETHYDFKHYDKFAMKPDGTPIRYSVYTATMKQCLRSVYQQMKKESVQ